MHAMPEAMRATDSLSSAACVFGDEPARDFALVVEDNDCVASLVGHLLDRSGQRVLRARDAGEAELLFAAHLGEIAWVMLDCRLPDMDGHVLCRRLRELRPELPVLFTSGQNYAGQRAFDDGITSFVAKPFLPGQFTRQVNSLLAGIA